MKPNPFGFNLNFDEFLVRDASEGVAFGVLAPQEVDAAECVGHGVRKDATPETMARLTGPAMPGD
jgi:hypothetical protein